MLRCCTEPTDATGRDSSGHLRNLLGCAWGIYIGQNLVVKPTVGTNALPERHHKGLARDLNRAQAPIVIVALDVTVGAVAIKRDPDDAPGGVLVRRLFPVEIGLGVESGTARGAP